MSHNNSIIYSLSFCLIISLILSIFMFYRVLKERKERKLTYFIWGVGFIFFVSCYILDILIVLGIENLKVIREGIRISGHSLLLFGLLLITGVSFQEKFVFPCMFLILGILLLVVSHQHFRFISSIFRGISMFLIAYNFNLLRRSNFSLGSSILALYFFLSGLHDLDYFLLRLIQWYAPYGFTLYGIFLFIIFYGFLEISGVGEKRNILNNKLFIEGVILGTLGIILNMLSPIYFKNTLFLADSMVIIGIIISIMPFVIFINRKEEM